MSDDPQNRPRVVRSQAYREIYANIVNPRMNLFDCGVTFGYATSQPGSGALDLMIEEVHVTMSYAETKYLTAVLSKFVKAYEEEFGPVPTQALPPEADEFNRQVIQALKNNRLEKPS